MNVERIFQRLQDLFSGEPTDDAAQQLILSLEEFFSALAKEFNASIPHEPLMITVRRSAAGDAEHQPGEHRLLVFTSFWALSIRAATDTVLFFMVPATEILFLADSELPSRLKLRLVLDRVNGKTWTMDGSAVSADEMSTLARSLLKDVITRSQGEYDLMPESMRMVAGGLSLSGSVKSLVAEKNALVQKIVNQQEAILNRLAREIHDAVLGNVMLLKSSVSGSRTMSAEAMDKLLEEISLQLRNICHDLYPRDLKDCGLKLMLEELCFNFSARTGCACNFICDDFIPELADEATLHVYRIAQECLNNVAKHATASSVELEISCDAGVLTMSVGDNGCGIEKALSQANHGAARALADGGSGGAAGAATTRYSSTSVSDGAGTSIMKERADLIDCLYPTRFWLESSSEKGTKVTLQIMFASSQKQQA